MRATYYEKIMDASSAGVDHARDSAKFVQVVTAALTGVYTTMLGLVFSASDRPLPTRAILPTLFFGFALALSLAYLAYLKRPDDWEPPAGQTDAQRQLERAAWFSRWVASGLDSRRWAMRCAVVAFAVGVALLPAPFIAPPTTGTADELPTPPSIPSALAPLIAEDAAEVFRAQARLYTEAAEAEPAPPRRCSSSHIVDVLWKCTWRTDSGINTAFLQLSLFGLVLMVALPLSSSVYDRRRTRSGEEAVEEGPGEGADASAASVGG